MCEDLDCGICYRVYNTGRRCPRLLSCKHSFCESCLITLSRRAPCHSAKSQTDSTIVCPLCRHATSLTDGGVKDKLPVDEDVLERMMTSGVLEANSNDNADDEEPHNDTSDHCSVTQTDSDNDTSPTTRRGKVWRSLCRFCDKITGGNRRGDSCMTDQDVRDLALMSCYMI
ncbi:RING finger protein 227 [Chanos chanos]|uniref:RING finger protein 227 n=1 Tax=Chanos chanos TaxID=29144 RepID=A0A6J2VVV4_CHACN|nr:RING finger protein 227-like [Chanos chanos]